MPDNTFATALNCMDGRTQEPVARWLKETFGVDFVDAVTEPGINKALTDGPDWQVESIRQKVLISVNIHGSRTIAVVGHHNCAGFPAPQEEQVATVKKAVGIVSAWNLPVRVLGLWVDDNWQVEVIADTGSD